MRELFQLGYGAALLSLACACASTTELGDGYEAESSWTEGQLAAQGAGTGGCGAGSASSATTVVELQPGPDAAMDTQIVFAEGPVLGTHGNENFGQFGVWSVGCYDHNTIIRSLLRFELPASIKARRILSAKLVLAPNAWIAKDPVGPLAIYVHKVLRPWKEGTVSTSDVNNSASIDGATARESSFGVSWSTIGMGQDGVDASSAYVSSLSKTYDASNPDLSPWSFDVTAYVRDWANNAASNHGFLLKSNEQFKSETEDSYSFPQFHSGESAEAAKRPKLVVTYKL